MNVADLFFDLLFVAAAYNTGNIIKNSPTWRGLLYFLGTFLPMTDIWQNKLYYEARYIVKDDLYHRLTDTAIVLVVAAAVLHIRPVAVLSDPRGNTEMFVFCLAQLVACLLQFIAEIELYMCAKGDRTAIQKGALRTVQMRILPFLCFLSAAIVAGYYYYDTDDSTNSGSGSYRRVLAGDDGTASTYNNSNNSTTTTTNDYGEYDTRPFQSDVPIWLCLAAPIVQSLSFVASIQWFFPNDGSHKQMFVPINIDFLIHRNGEWTMLLLGEGILSLLIVDVTEGKDYYTTFYSGLLTMVLLQYLHFRSQPHDPDHHACRRDKNAGTWWVIFNEIYSAALIVVGVSFKLFLFEFGYDEPERRLQRVDYLDTSRMLAGDSGDAYLSTEQRRQNIANLFCGGLAVAWVCLDTMTLLHFGFGGIQRITCPRTKKTKLKAVALLVARAVLLCFVALLGRFETNPDRLAVWSLVAVVLQLVLRQIGGMYFSNEEHNSFSDETNDHHTSSDGAHPGKKANVDPEEGKWPNITHAVAIPAEAVPNTDKTT